MVIIGWRRKNSYCFRDGIAGKCLFLTKTWKKVKNLLQERMKLAIFWALWQWSLSNLWFFRLWSWTVINICEKVNKFLVSFVLITYWVTTKIFYRNHIIYFFGNDNEKLLLYMSIHKNYIRYFSFQEINNFFLFFQIVGETLLYNTHG